MGPNDALTNHPAAPAPGHQPPVLPTQPAVPHPAPVSHAAPVAHAAPTHTVPPVMPNAAPVPVAHQPHEPALPSSHIGQRAAVKQSSPLYTLGSMSVVVLVVGWLLVSLLGLTRSSESKELDKKLTDLDDQLNTPAMIQATEQYTMIETVVTQSKQLREERLLFNPVWQTVKQNVPKDVQFTSFSLGEDGTFRVVGLGRSVTSVAQFAAALAQQGKFTTVTPLSVEKQDNQEIYGFSISFKQGNSQ